ncbi:MAG: Xaa-Pro peptidase family protein [Microvirga sp.]
MIPAIIPVLAETLPFALSHYAERRDALIGLMKEREIDVIALTSTENICYLTGFGSFAFGRTALVLGTDGVGRWVIRKTEYSNIRALSNQLWVNDGVGVADHEDFGAELLSTLRELAAPNAKVGIELDSVQASARPFLVLAAGEIPIVNASGLVESLRRRKSPEEIKLLRRAGAIAAQACRDGFEALEEGMSDSALGAVVTNSLILNGSAPVVQFPAVCAGPRTARAHISWRGAPIRRGDIINVEPAASVFDYHTPIFRIFSMGPPPDEVRRMFDVCRAALDEGYAEVRPGMTSHEAARIFETVIERAGCAEFMVTRPAYSIGLAFAPGWGEDNVVNIRRDNEQILEEGMCFHVVPCLYRDGIGCVAASMPSLLTRAGFESLSGDEAILLVR